MKFDCCLIIKKKYFSEYEVDELLKHLETYGHDFDTLHIYNISNEPIDFILEKLDHYHNINYVEGENAGEVYNYHSALKLCYESKADFATIMEVGYYFEDGVISALKTYCLSNPDSCVVTPNPTYSCEEPLPSQIKNREILGCHLIGALINIQYYVERGFKEKYFQTTFDYEYCLYHRSKGRKVILLPNEVLRNTNFILKEKKFLFFKARFFERDLMDVYYETRNRLYLWDEYKDIDPEYVKLDKKEFKNEVREMRLKDKSYGDKKLMINRAKTDYLAGKVGFRNFKY